MRQTAAIMLSTVIATTLGTTAMAQGGATGAAAQPGPMDFAQFDRDGDGAVTEAEFNQARAERIAQRSSAGAPMRGLANAPAFSEIDQNDDGTLTQEELASFRQQRMRGGGGTGPGAGAPGRGTGGGMGRGMGRMGGQMPAFSAFDSDGDGVLTEDELAEGRAQRIKERSQQGYRMRNLANAPSFETIDQDGDGTVDKQEFETAQREHMLEHRRMMQR